MFFNNKPLKSALVIAILNMVFVVTSSYGLEPSVERAPLTSVAILNLAKKTNLVSAVTPEVVSEINNIRANIQARTYMQSALERMKQYQPVVTTCLKENDMPADLLALPLVESGYRPLDPNKNLISAAGIWQIIPSTAKDLGLTVTAKRDDRLNTTLSTKAALAYLNRLHAKYDDWRLAVIAYEIGEKETNRLIKKTGSREAWTLVRSSQVPLRLQEELKNYLTMFDASVIIMHNPSIIT